MNHPLHFLSVGTLGSRLFATARRLAMSPWAWLLPVLWLACTCAMASTHLLIKLHDSGRSTAEAALDAARRVARQHPALTGTARATGEQWFRLDTRQAMPHEALAEVATQLRHDKRVAQVLQPGRERLTAVPNDTLYSTEQWWLGAFGSPSFGVPGMPAAWDRSTGAPVSGLAPVVAVLDSGYTPHPELDSKWLGAGYDFVSSTDHANDGNGRDNDARDPGDRLTAEEIAANRTLWDGCEARSRSSWHGTLMAGQIGAVSNNSAGVAGLHWALDARLLPVRVAGRCGAAVDDVIDGLRWAAGLAVDGVPANPHPAKVIVIGVAGFGSCNPLDVDPNVGAAAQRYIDALAAVRAAGTLVVAAAGNQRSAVGRPASCPGAFAVTSVNRQGFKAIYANTGPEVALATVGGDGAQGADCDDLLADTGIASTSNRGENAQGTFGYAAGSGTSFAAPVVAGISALMWSLNPSLTVAEIEAGLRQSARPHVQVPMLGVCDAASGNRNGRCQCTTGQCGAGILAADQALAYAANPSGYNAPTGTPAVIATTAVRQCAVRLGLPVPSEPGASAPTSPAPVATASGGGAVSWHWLVALVVGVAALHRGRRGKPTAH